MVCFLASLLWSLRWQCLMRSREKDGRMAKLTQMVTIASRTVNRNMLTRSQRAPRWRREVIGRVVSEEIKPTLQPAYNVYVSRRRCSEVIFDPLLVLISVNLTLLPRSSGALFLLSRCTKFSGFLIRPERAWDKLHLRGHHLLLESILCFHSKHYMSLHMGRTKLDTKVSTTCTPPSKP
jgi:hypothetical protein